MSVSEVRGIGASLELTDVLSERMLDRVRRLGDCRGEIIVRSSVVGESIWDRGKYESVIVSCKANGFVEDLNHAARSVIASTSGQGVGFLIQRFVSPVQKGEFGNLQRISKTRDHWEISTVGQGGLTSRQRLTSPRDRAADSDCELAIRPGLARERLFGSIGAWLNNDLLLGRRQRLNCEWVTDNVHYYLVQIDEEGEDFRGVNPFQVRIPPAIQPASVRGKYLRMADEHMIACWDKLQVLNELWEPGAAHKPTLFAVQMSDVPDRADTVGREELVEDFLMLIGSAGIVVRTSVPAGTEKVPNLRRTQELSPEQAADWCVETATTLSEDYSRSQLAFVAHRFVAARANAWVRVDPGSALVKVHAIWGLPDALQFCPYDTWEVHLPTGVATDYPDYKSDMLISQADGKWDYVRVKNEFARYNCISSLDAKELALRSSRIAARVNGSCHIMWFVGCVQEDGTEFNIPWYWTPAHDSQPNRDRAAYRVFAVSDPQSLQEFIDWKGSRDRQALELRPTDLDLMRDNTFIENVGVGANSARVPVILAGSTLAHAYYLLRKKGCSVVTPTEKKHSRIRRKVMLGKLVRDKIPGKIIDRRELSITKEMTGNLKRGFLLGKFFEEAMEVRGAREFERKVEEFSDLYEIFRALAKSEGISLDLIESTADQKLEDAGGFDKGLVLVQTGISPSDQRQGQDLEQGMGELLVQRISEDTVEIPFTFFGFMEFDRARSIMLEHFGIWLQVSLRPDRIEVKLVEEPEQLGLPL